MQKKEYKMKRIDRRSFFKTVGRVAVCGGLITTNRLTASANPPSQNRTLNKNNESWSLVILPDTQNYSNKYPGLFCLQTRWILDNKDRYNIVYVLQNGDVTDNNIPIQWERASRAMGQLDGKVPYALSLGNHDFGHNGSTNDRSTLANDYFPPSRFKGLRTFGGVMEANKIDNTYHIFKAAGDDYLLLCLEFGPRNETLEWANTVITKHPHHKAIIMTHAYLYSDSTRYDWPKYGNTQEWNPHNYPIAKMDTTTVNDGQEMWDKLVKKHPNIFMTINGHVLNDGLGYLVSQGEGGNNVHQMLVNFQMLDVGGGAWLRILNFQADGKTVNVEDYSPLYETFNTEPENQFLINL